MVQSMSFSSLLTDLLSFYFLFGVQIKKGFFSSYSHILINIPSMNYYNYFVKIFHTERFTILQTRFQNKKQTGIQKQLLADVLLNRCSWKFSIIHRKARILESLFDKVARLQSLHHKRFPRIFVKFSRTSYNESPYTTKIAYG